MNCLEYFHNIVYIDYAIMLIKQIFGEQGRRKGGNIKLIFPIL